MTNPGAGLWKQLPPAPSGHAWTLDFGSVSDDKGNVYEKVYVALLKGRDTVRRGVIDVQLYGYSGAIEWARHVLRELA